VDNERKIFWIKFVHSIAFLMFTACVGFVLYSGLFNRIGRVTWVCIVVVVVEGLALALNRFRCPLTTLAENLGAEDGSVTGIFLPRWLAKRVFLIWGQLFVAGCILVVVRLMTAD
jgi:hypothetical protein